MIENKIKNIILTKGYCIIVDDADFEWINSFNWTVDLNKYGAYARRNVRKGNKGKLKKIYLHRFIMECPKGFFIDHINGDGLDNRRCNLRICNHSENMRNCKSNIGISRYKGVYKHKYGKLGWKSAICIERKQIHLGVFASEKEAALAYNLAAVQFHGRYAKINDIWNCS